MTGPPNSPVDMVASLMLERQRYESWLAQIESRRGSTPPHVFERVRADYEARLRDVLARLAGRTAEVQATVGALTERVARLQMEEGALRDERVEAELRHAAGEFTATEWQEIVRASDERIGRTSAERQSVIIELQKLQQILSMAGAVPRAELAAPPPPPRPSKPARFDELEFLNSVVDTRGTRGGPDLSELPMLSPEGNGTNVPGPRQGRREGPSDEAPPRPATPVPQPEPRREPVRLQPPRPEPPRAEPPRTEPPRTEQSARGQQKRRAEPPPPPRESTPPRAATPVPVEPPPPPPPPPTPASRVERIVEDEPLPPPMPEPPPALEELLSEEPEPPPPEALPSFLRDVPQEQVKTLKCAECGSMNLPTEWYCERCGSELAAM